MKLTCAWQSKVAAESMSMEEKHEHIDADDS